MSLTNAIKEILNNLNTLLRAQNFYLGDYLSDQDDALANGNLGIAAAAGDVDSVCQAGGNFARDRDVSDGSPRCCSRGRRPAGGTARPW
jgi:hypothetical protein